MQDEKAAAVDDSDLQRSQDSFESSHNADDSRDSSEGLLKQERDVESQQPAPVEHFVSLRVKLLFLAAYFFLNLFLTLSNKSVLGKVRSRRSSMDVASLNAYKLQAKLPWLLTACHASATSLGCFAMLGFGAIKVTKLGLQENLILIAFSILFTINIAVSNVSLAMVSVPFHQIMRSTCPVVAILIYRFAYARTYSTQTYLTMIPLIFGVALSTAGDYYFTIAFTYSNST